MLKKRLNVSQARRAELEKAKNYLICCRPDECECGQSSGVCERGFFSLFLQAVNGILFANHFRLHPVVNFGNLASPYGDPDLDDPNFWNYFFVQENELPGHTVMNHLVEAYPLRIWHRSIVREIHHQVIKKLRFRPDVENHLNQAVQAIKHKKTLGIHWRGTDHHEEIKPVPLNKLIQRIHEKIPQFDMLYVATDEQPVLDQLNTQFKGRVISTNVARSTTGRPIHIDPEMVRGRKLGLDVLTDCVCLSQCDEVILMQSNVSYSVLLFNPEIPYTLLESNAARWNRRKTILVYLLDRLGIRK